MQQGHGTNGRQSTSTSPLDSVNDSPVSHFRGLSPYGTWGTEMTESHLSTGHLGAERTESRQSSGYLVAERTESHQSSGYLRAQKD